MSDPGDCIFCKIVAGELPSDTVHETPTTVAFKDLHPAAPLHVLVVPRRHIDDASAVGVEDAPVLADMLLAARAVADGAGLASPERGYRLVFNVGSRRHEFGPAPAPPRARGKPLSGHLGVT